jgi:TolA-binding protein
MTDIEKLMHRAQQLEDQARTLREGIDQLRFAVIELQMQRNENHSAAGAPKRDCLVEALSLAQDLGDDFSASDPHRLADRGADWFAEP